jgi:S-adenosylmethionine-diacylgycerolhomoserine-N-methlytransferase
LAHPGAHPGATAAEHMDAIYRYQRYIYDASRKYYLLGRDRLIEELEPPPGARVLEVACGTGRNLIKAARRYPQARFYGFDISRAMLDTAQASILRHGLADRVIVAAGDATDFSAERLIGVPAFDRVFVSYSLSMIPPWRAALRQAFAAVAPGGRLHVVDFGDQAELPRWFRTGLRAWLAKFSVEPRAELEAELEKLAAETGARLEFQRMFRDYAQRAVLLKP